MTQPASRSVKYSFENADGQTLSARLELPSDGDARAFAVCAHCFTCSKNLKAVGHISRALASNGVGVLRFDFTGLGESEGDFADTTFSSNVEDLVSAAQSLASQYKAPRILVGHSLGGAAVLQAAARIDSIEAVATIGAPFDPQHVERLFESSRDEIVQEGKAVVKLAGRKFTIKKQFLDDLASAGYEEGIHNLRTPLLVMHSPIDQTVGVENAAAIYKAAKHPKSFISLDTADHLLTEEKDSRYAGTMIAAWANKYVGYPEDEPRHADAADNNVIATIGSSGFLTEISANGHVLQADEPASVGGTNMGPTPYDLVAAGLASCTAMTLRMYADHKDWPLEEVRVYVHHEKVHVDDCECETDQPGKIDVLSRRVELVGSPLSDDQQDRLIEIANRCPVHRTLEGDIVIRTEGGVVSAE